MAEIKNEDFQARDYQTRLSERAIEKNQIIYLPTGSGKTYISTLVISHFCKVYNAQKTIAEGGKKAFFLVNTVALVHQQSGQIQDRLPYNVAGYSGDMGVDNWSNETWAKELAQNHIFVMTSQIFLNLLLSNIISLKNVAVLVFDECHHAVADHPMRQIMQQFKKVSPDQQPRVVGLTATLLNKNMDASRVTNEIKTLETTFMAQIATADSEEMVKMYSTNPKEFQLRYHKNTITTRCYQLRNQVFEDLKLKISLKKITDIEKADNSIRPNHAAHQIGDRSKKINKEILNVLTDIAVNMDELGLYGGHMSVLAHLIQLQKMIVNCQSKGLTDILNFLSTQLICLRKFFEIEMSGSNELERIKKYSSPKVLKLLDTLKTFTDEDSAIVFVTRRFTAKIMHLIISEAAKVHPKLKRIKCDFIVGYNIANPFKDTRENFLQRHYNNRVLAKFNSGLLNVLFGSNVVEEGMDISKCNTVIMFDPPNDFRSYIQSKGRARHATSRYIIFYSDDKILERCTKYRVIEQTIQNILCDGRYLQRDKPTQEDVDATLFASIPGLEPYQPDGDKGPSITALSAISHVNRYFASLKVDKFTKATPFWFLESRGTSFKCYLHLPMESRVRGMVEGTWQNTKENAKRSAALEACKRLHKGGELDDQHLLPVTIHSKTISHDKFMPNKGSDDEFFEQGENGKVIRLGTKNNKRSWIKKWPDCLSGCKPEAGKDNYLHVLDIRPINKPPEDNHRLVVFHQVVSTPVTYAILSSKPLPKLASFPLYMSTGELEVKVSKSIPIKVDQKQLKKLSRFHGILFDEILEVVKSFFIRDFSNTRNAYLIAPVKLDGDNVTIDWDVMEMGNKPFPDPFQMPSDEARRSLVINDENYLGMLVSPWYRRGDQKYIVTKVCYDMSEESEFPSENYPTYSSYFEDKYKIVPLIHQPLLEVRALSSRMNHLKPMTLTKALKRQKDENEEFEVWLIPEFCVLYPVPGRYWVKAQLLPSVLHRITQLCTAEELRTTIVRKVEIGLMTLPSGESWKKLEGDPSLIKHESTDEQQMTQMLTPLNLMLKSQSSDSKFSNRVWELDEEPVDIDRNFGASLFDIEYYNTFINLPLSRNLKKVNIFSEDRKFKLLKMVDPPVLKMLQKNPQDLGPQQVGVLQAITVAFANDLIDCERLETLGDSFLKFAISLILAETQEDWSEGLLTNLKGQIVGNKNLYFCGKKKTLQNILEVRSFSPREEWVPPQFCVDYKMQATISLAHLNPSCLYNLRIPKEEVASGDLSAATIAVFTDILLNKSENQQQNHTCTFTNELALTDKNIADAVEAILGVYLENSGVFGALKVMKWFEVINPSLATEAVFTDRMTKPVRSNWGGSPSDHLIQPEVLEEILNYKFNDRAYMLQALTHPSFTKNNITACYQRLEFLGDAVIDFLITVHIFERCKQLHPGDLTDLRSALVNNITLGCLTVRHHLHLFLLHRSSLLTDIMTRFAKHQEERNHEIDNDILFLCEENETNLSEAVDVPKALGDVFESLIGAIYLDSGKSLDVTWRIIYNVMKDEIEKFSSDVPKNHIRMLYETCQRMGFKPEFKSGIDADGVVMVELSVDRGTDVKTFQGFGDNKLQAKRAASKHALRHIRSTFNL